MSNLTMKSLDARLAAADARQDKSDAAIAALGASLADVAAGVLVLTRGLTPAGGKADATDAPKADVAKADVARTKVLTRTSLRAFKATKAGKAYTKAHAGASVSGIVAGEFPMPAGFHAPTGERREAIAAWKAAQA
jgi:hypothetical protein